MHVPPLISALSNLQFQILDVSPVVISFPCQHIVGVPRRGKRLAMCGATGADARENTFFGLRGVICTAYIAVHDP